MKMLVTGAAGFIGHHLTRWLLSDGFEVVGVDSLDNGTYERIIELSEVFKGNQFVFHHANLCDEAFVQRLFHQTAFDTIFHLAAMGSVPRSFTFPSLVAFNNINSTINLLEASLQTRVRSFIYSSSSSVYGEGERIRVEEDPLEPRSPYATTKLCCEKLVKLYYEIHGLPTLSLRYFNVFGPAQSIHGGYPAVIPSWIKAVRDEDPVRVFGDGKQTRDFTYVDDVVEANLLAFRAPTELACGMEFNIGCGVSTSVNELLELVFGALGRRVEVEHMPPRAGDIRASEACIARAQAILGFKPSVDICEGVSRTVEWYVRRYL